MIRSNVTALVAILLLGLSGHKEETSVTLLDHREQGLVLMAIAGPGAMSPHFLLRTYDDLMLKASNPLKVVAVNAFRDASNAVFLNGKGHTEATYEQIVRQIKIVQSHVEIHMMRLTGMGENVVLQEVSGTRVTRTVLRGSDPTMFSIAGYQCELLEWYFNRLPRPMRPNEGNPVIFTAYVKVNHMPDFATAEEIVKAIKRLSGQSYLRVEMRTDTWFLEDMGFPLWYPFENDRIPPGFSEFRARGQISCTSDERLARCYGNQTSGGRQGRRQTHDWRDN